MKKIGKRKCEIIEYKGEEMKCQEKEQEGKKMRTQQERG